MYLAPSHVPWVAVIGELAGWLMPIARGAPTRTSDMSLESWCVGLIAAGVVAAGAPTVVAQEGAGQQEAHEPARQATDPTASLMSLGFITASCASARPTSSPVAADEGLGDISIFNLTALTRNRVDEANRRNATSSMRRSGRLHRR